ncbi:hypothetical protein NMY22_g18884 [Coprinellus aureogranulatus]|nr:hypothetical protein NMY22_g18884 [Coprinellus aureogranulatus]
MRYLNLDISVWVPVVPEGGPGDIELSQAPIESLNASMSYADLCLLKINWNALSKLTGRTSAGDVDNSAVVELVRRYGAQLTDFSFGYASMTAAAITMVLQLLPNVVHLEAVDGDHLRSRQSRRQHTIDTRTLATTVIQRLASPQHYSTQSEAEEFYLCPKLRTVTYKFGKMGTAEHEEDMKRSVVKLIVNRRRDPRGTGSGEDVAYLKSVKVGFEYGAVDWMMDELRREGVDVEDVTFASRYPGHRSKPKSNVATCTFPGMGPVKMNVIFGQPTITFEDDE